MNIKDFDELENRLNEVNINLTHIQSLSKVLLDCMCNKEDFHEVEALTSILIEKIIELKVKFNLLEVNVLKNLPNPENC